MELRVIQASANTSDDFSTNKTLLDLINGKPEDIAVVYDDGAFSATRFLTYEDLHTYSHKVTNQLKQAGFSAGFVGVYINHMELYPAILLGILSAGGAFYCINSDSYRLIDKEELNILAMLDVKYLITDEIHRYEFNDSTSGYQFSIAPLLQGFPSRFLSLYLMQGMPFSWNCWDRKIFNYEELEKRSPADKYAYAIKTSGTTGISKLVLVPHRAIVPNVISFVEKVFRLNQNDSIFGASPPTFDPSIVELWMAFLSGCRIVYTSMMIKLNPTQLTQVFFRNDISVLQCTPSLFYRFSEVGATQLLKLCTNLKFVAFGGEPCPQKLYLEKLIPPHNKVNFYNLYGTTEMSCWASVSKVDFGDLSETSIMDFPEPDTFYKIIQNENGQLEILLGTRRRQCQIFNTSNGRPIDSYSEFKKEDEIGISYIRTGDTVNCEDLPRVTYKNRTDNLVKRNGQFVDLHDLETRIMTIPWLQLAKCYSSHGEIIVIAVLAENCSSDENLEYRRKIFVEVARKVAIKNLPDRLKVITPSQISLTANGKFYIDERKNTISARLVFESDGPPKSLPYDKSDVAFIVQDAWKLYLYTEETKLGDNFLMSGGDSTRAMLFVEHIFQNLHLFGTLTQQEFALELMQIVFEETLLDIINYVTSVIYPKCHFHVTITGLTTEMPNALEIEQSHKVFMLRSEELKTELSKLSTCLKEQSYPHVIYNMLGCVDSTPVLVQHPECGPLIIATSNSGYVFIIKCQRFQFSEPVENIFFRHKFPDRLVASCGRSQDNRHIFIPCCDFRLYAVELHPKTHIVWSYFTGGLLRSTPVVDDKVGIVIVISENDTVFGLRTNDGHLIWKHKIERVLSHNPLLRSIEQDDTKSVFFTSAKGIWKLDVANGKEMTSFPLEDIYTDLVPHWESSMFCCGTLKGRLIHVLKDTRSCIESIATIPTGSIINTPIISRLPNPNMGEPLLIYVTKKEGTLCVSTFSELEGFKNLDFHQFEMKVDAEAAIIPVDNGEESMIAFTSSGDLKFRRRKSIPPARNCPASGRHYSQSESRMPKAEPVPISNGRSIVFASAMCDNEIILVEGSISIPDSFIPNAENRLTGIVHCVDNIYCFGGRDDCLHFIRLNDIRRHLKTSSLKGEMNLTY